MKNYIIDTNVMIHDPNFMFNFEDNNIIIPIICIEELDKIKSENSIRGYNARMVLKNLNSLREKYNQSLHEGITLETKGTIRIELDNIDKVSLPNAMQLSKNDNKILAIALSLSEKYKEEDIETILVTKDLACAIKADSLGLKIQDYKNDKIDIEDLYTGLKNIYVPNDIFNIFSQEHKVSLSEINVFDTCIYENEFVNLLSFDNTKSLLTQLKNNELIQLNTDFGSSSYILKPRNKEQKLTYQLLMDDEIPFVTLSGKAGCGKTLLAISAALEKIEKNIYDKIILVRPIIPAGEDIGFLPGTEEEKLKPWMGAFYDAVENILRIKKQKITADKFIEDLKANGKLEIKSFTYMRGRTLSNAFVIVDEAQEITPHIAKLMLTRIGENAKIVMTGDPSDNQIDNSFVNSKTNGLVYVIEKCKTSKLTGHLELQKVERSAIAELMQKVL